MNNYTTANATDILESLFWMETFGLLELFKLEQVREPDEDWVIRGSYNEPNYFQYHAPIGITVKYNLVNEFMQEWYTRYVAYHQNTISKDRYTNWKLNWPNSCDIRMKEINSKKDFRGI